MPPCLAPCLASAFSIALPVLDLRSVDVDVDDTRSSLSFGGGAAIAAAASANFPAEPHLDLAQSLQCRWDSTSLAHSLDAYWDLTPHLLHSAHRLCPANSRVYVILSSLNSSSYMARSLRRVGVMPAVLADENEFCPPVGAAPAALRPAWLPGVLAGDWRLCAGT